MFSNLSTIVAELLAWWEKLLNFFPKAVVGLIIFAIFIAVGRIVRKITKRAVDHFSDSPSFIRLSGTVAFIITLIIGAAVALAILDLDEAATSLLAGVGVVGLALGFAFQDIASNFIAGAALSVRKQFEVGDVIETGEFFTTVENVELRNTTLRTYQGQLVTMPNKKLFEEPLINYTASGERMIEILCGVSYDDDLVKVERVARKAVESIPERDKSKSIDFYYQEFGDSSINFSLRFWIKYPEEDYMKVYSDSIRELKQAFDKEGITIPFPIRTIYAEGQQS